MAYQGLNQPKPVGSIIDDWNEHRRVNAGTFNDPNDSDDWRQTSHVMASPANPGLSQDTTNYATQPTQDSWNTRVRGQKTQSGGLT